LAWVGGRFFPLIATPRAEHKHVLAAGKWRGP
jgi:hypothetical protein